MNFFRGRTMRRCLFIYRLLQNQYRTGVSNSCCVSVRTPNMVRTGAFLPRRNKVGSYQGQKNVSWVCTTSVIFTGKWFVLGGCRKVRNAAPSASSASAAPRAPFVSGLSLCQKTRVRYDTCVEEGGSGSAARVPAL